MCYILCYLAVCFVTFPGLGIDGRETYYNDLWKFDFERKSWEQLSTSKNPSPRYSAFGGVREFYFFLSHGTNDEEQYSNTFTFDVDRPSRGWTEIHSGISKYDPKQPHARQQSTGTILSDDKVLMFGGCLRFE